MATLLLLVSTAAVLAASMLRVDAQQDKIMPNILVIVGDDLGTPHSISRTMTLTVTPAWFFVVSWTSSWDKGYNDVGFHGAEIPTPNIDSLARNAVRLSNYHSSCIACCCPSVC